MNFCQLCLTTLRYILYILHYIWMNPLLMNVFPFILTPKIVGAHYKQLLVKLLRYSHWHVVYILYMYFFFLCRIQLQVIYRFVLYTFDFILYHSVPRGTMRLWFGVGLRVFIIISCSVLCLRVSFLFFFLSISSFGWQRHVKL